MNTTLIREGFRPAFPAGGFREEKAEFRRKFSRSLRHCVRRGFSVEECFGLIWEETLEQVRLSDREQSELYEELIAWAKAGLK